jgi:inhibitor of KinA
VSTFRVVEAGDSALVVEFEERIDPAVNARVVALADRLRVEPVAGVRDVVPAFRSVAVYFDPLRTSYDALVGRLEREAAAPDLPARPQLDVIRVPVCYGGELGPDLGDVARFAGMTESAVVDVHTGPTYFVFMLGFAPGMAYLGVVDGRIAAPRRGTPRVRVPRGSVGIAGEQTGIYPAETPGGWQIIGRTPLRPFNLARPSPFLMKAGDLVSFYAIDRAEFDRLEQATHQAAG